MVAVFVTGTVETTGDEAVGPMGADGLEREDGGGWLTAGAGLGRADLIVAAICCWTTAMMSSIDTVVGEGRVAAGPFMDFELGPDGHHR